MKKLIFVALTLIVGVGYAQEKDYELNNRRFKTIENSIFDCLYLYTIEGTNSEGNEFKDVFNTILQIGNGGAKYWDYGAFLADSVEFIAKANTIEQQKRLRQQINFYDSEIFQNMPKDKITENGIIGINYYTYSEPKRNLKWTLQSDTLTVLGTLCHKATVEYGGREWTAWYAPSIPVSYGPWKLSGLPGLILKAKDNSGMFTFEAVAIRDNQLPIYEKISMQRTKVPQAKFHKTKVIHEFNPWDIDMESASEFSVTSAAEGSVVSIDGVIIREYQNDYHSLEVVELKQSEIPVRVRR